MDHGENLWIHLPKYSQGYIRGIRAFIQHAFPKFAVGEEMPCPCINCKNAKWHSKDLIHDHLICNGPSPMYVNRILEVSGYVPLPTYQGTDEDSGLRNYTDFRDNLEEMLHRTNGPNADAKKFYDHLEQGKQPLYPSCKKFSRLSFVIRLYSLKCVHGITEAGFGDILQLTKDAFLEASLPLSFNGTKIINKELWLNYNNIHAYPNHCRLY